MACAKSRWSQELSGLLISIPALIMSPEQFHRSYLFAYICCLAIPLGCIALVMMHHLTGGGWGFIIRRILEAGTRTIWLMAILYLPMLVGLSRIYGWARPDAASIPVYQQKHFYLNVPFFMVRSVIYFALWLGLAWLLNKWSAQQDEPGNPSAEKKLEGISGPGLVLWGIAVTFSAVDLVMSLEPTWFSSIYGMMIMIVYALSAMAFVIFIARRLTEREPLVRHRNGAAIQRPWKFPADVRDAVGVSIVLAILDYLVGQHAGGNQLVHDARTRKLGSVGADTDYFPFCDSVCVAAFAGH